MKRVLSYLFGTALIVIGLIGFAFMPWGFSLFLFLGGVATWVAVVRSAAPKDPETKQLDGGTGLEPMRGPPVCHQCQEQIDQESPTCQHCGALSAPDPSNSPTKKKSTDFKTIGKRAGIVTGVILLLLFIIGLAAEEEESEQASHVGTEIQVASERTTLKVAPVPVTPTYQPLNLPSPKPTQIPGLAGRLKGAKEVSPQRSPVPENSEPTLVPTPNQITATSQDALQVELGVLLYEYDQNKVRS